MQNTSLVASAKLATRTALGAGIFIFFHMTYRYIIRLNFVNVRLNNPFIALYNDFLDNLLYLAFFLLVVGIVANFFLQKKLDEQKSVQRVYAISGYVYLANKKPIEGAAIYVDGIDTRKRTDVDGWFRVQVDARRSWKVTAMYQGKDVERTVKHSDVQTPLKMTLPISVLSRRSAG